MGGSIPFLGNGKVTVRCPACGKRNAVALERAAAGPVCGRCKAGLAPPDQPIELSDATFDRFVADAPWPVLVDFWAPWCGPCRAMGPVVEQLARARAGEALVAKLDTQANPRTAARLGIQSIPTVVVFDRGRPVSRQVGLVDARALDSMLSRAA